MHRKKRKHLAQRIVLSLEIHFETTFAVSTYISQCKPVCSTHSTLLLLIPWQHVASASRKHAPHPSSHRGANLTSEVLSLDFSYVMLKLLREGP